MNEELVTTVLEELQNHSIEASLTKHAPEQALGHEVATVLQQLLEQGSKQEVIAFGNSTGTRSGKCL